MSADTVGEPPPGSDDALAARVATLASSRVLSGILDAVTLVLLVRTMDRADFGVFSLAFAAFEVARQLGASGMPEAALVYCERLGGAAHRAVLAAARRALVPGALVTGLVLAAAPTVARPLFGALSPESIVLLGRLAPYVAAAALADVIASPHANVLVAAGSPRAAAGLQVGSSLGSGLAMLAAAALGDALDVARMLALGTLLRLALGALLVHRTLADGAGHAPSELGLRLRRFAWPLGLHTAAARLHRHLDKALVVLILGESAGAAYAAVAFEIPFLAALPFAVGTALVGRYVEAHRHTDTKGLLALHHRGIRKLGLAVIPTTVFLIVFADRIVPLVLGEGYPDAVAPFRIATLVSLQRVAQFGVILQATGETRAILVLTLTMVGLNLLLAPPAMMALGLPGAAAAATLASFVVFFLYQRRIAQVLGCTLGEVFPWRTYGRQLASALACALAVGLLAEPVFASSLAAAPRLAASTALFLVTYLGLGTVLGLVERSDFRSLAILLGHRPQPIARESSR